MAVKRKSALDFFTSKDSDSGSDQESDTGYEKNAGSKELAISPNEDENDFSDEESDEEGKTSAFSKKRSFRESHTDDEDEEEEEEAEQSIDQDKVEGNKVTPITADELEKNLKKLKKSGVVYISRIPPYMKPIKMRQILSRFGEVNRIFLSLEDPKVYARRVKYGGNKKKNYTEGWAEFVRKKDAKLAAHTLNGNIIGGSKGSYYHDDILNVKYLPKFKWNNLTEQIALERQARQEKLKAEISQATRENKLFIENVERQKMISAMQEKRKQAGRPVDDQVRREFSQNSVTSARSGDRLNKKKKSENMDSVLSKVF